MRLFGVKQSANQSVFNGYSILSVANAFIAFPKNVTSFWERENIIRKEIKSKRKLSILIPEFFNEKI